MARNVTSSRLRHLALAALFMSAAGAAGAYLLQRQPAAIPALSLSCERGIEDVYAVSYASHGVLTDTAFGLGPAGAMPGEPLRVEAKVDGRMHAACIANTDEEQTLAVTFERVNGTFDVPGATGAEREVANLLAGTTFVTRDARGRIKNIRFDAKTPENGRSLVRDILALGQITLPELGKPTPASWTAREEDTNGAYEGAYRVTKNEGGALTIAKARQSIASGSRSDKLRPAATSKDGSSATFRMKSAEHRVAGADVTSAIGLDVNGKSVGSTDAHLVSTFEESSALSDDAFAALRGALAMANARVGAPSDLAAHDVDARLDAMAQRKELGKDNWETLSQKLDRLEGSSTPLFLKLRALFRLDPSRCAAAGKRLAQMNDPNADAYAALASALADAGNAESQRALVDAARSAEGNVPSQRVLVATLGMAKSPTGEMIDSLRGLARETTSGEIAGTARLALGSLARDAEVDPARAAALVASEVDACRHAQTSEEKIMALLTLGNSGAPQTLAIAREALGDPDPRVRAAAANALRFVESPEAEAALTILVGGDADAVVRAEAIRSLGFRTLGTPAVETIARAAETDRDEQVRLGAVKMLAGGPFDPALGELFARVAVNDIANSVRTAARLALVRYEQKG